MKYLEVRKKRLNLVLNQIKKNPDTWDQNTWDCRTKACFCGWGRRFSKGFGRLRINQNPNITYSKEEDVMIFKYLVKRLIKLLSVMIGNKNPEFAGYLLHVISPFVRFNLNQFDDLSGSSASYILFGAFFFRLHLESASSLFSHKNSLKDLEYQAQLLCEVKENVET